MWKETIEFEDYNGNKRTEDHWFNLTEAELTELMLGTTGGFDAMVKRLTEAQNVPEIIKVLKDIIARSYGIRSLDGRRFDKSPEILENFTRTEAYSKLFMKLAFDDRAAADFINGIVPKSISEATPQAGPIATTPMALAAENKI